MAPKPPDPAASAAVLIGASVYKDPGLDHLPGVVNNVADLAAVFADLSLWGLPPDRCAALVDHTDPGEVISTLSDLADRARDTFVCYYSGHGLLTREGDLVLASPGTNAALPKYTALPYTWIRDVVGRCRAARRIVILDCCFSGRALHAMSDPATAVVGQVDVDGIYVLTSSPATSVSFAPPDARNTAFTGGLLDILRAGIPGAGQLLSLDDVYEQTLLAMAQHGWPRPQRLGTNTVGRLGILRNRAWPGPRAPAPARSRADPGRRRQLAEGVRDAVGAVAAALGPTGRDGMQTLDRAFPAAVDEPPGGQAEITGWAAGVALVRETMLVMRQQFGDGATTAAIILGVLVDGLQSLLDQGQEPGALNAAAGAQIVRLARELRRVYEVPVPPADAYLLAVVQTALGRHEVAETVVAAARSVGAGNVEVMPGAAGATGVTPDAASAFVLDSKVLAPNAASGPITLEDPLVVVSTDGEIAAQALRSAAGKTRSPILIIAPRVSIFALRSLLHAFSQAVVVRPANPGFDLAALRRRIDPGETGAGWVRARRALVLSTTTTIDRPGVDLALSRNRITLTIPDRAGPGQLEVAVRALAVARSAATEGVVPGGGVALYQAVQALAPGDRSGSVIAAVVAAAAGEPCRRLRLGLPSDAGTAAAATAAAATGAPVDSLATVRGSLTQVAATLGRYLCGI